jgi:hypothetical protein
VALKTGAVSPVIVRRVTTPAATFVFVLNYSQRHVSIKLVNVAAVQTVKVRTVLIFLKDKTSTATRTCFGRTDQYVVYQTPLDS